MCFKEYEAIYAEDSGLYQLKGLCQIDFNKFNEQLSTTLSLKLVSFSQKYGYIFVAMNKNLIIFNIKDYIDSAKKMNFDLNVAVEVENNKVLQLPYKIHAIFINHDNSHLGIFCSNDSSNNSVDCFLIYEINKLMYSQDENDALIGTVKIDEFYLNVSENRQILCIENINSPDDTANFCIIVIYKGLKPLEIHYDVNSNKHTMNELSNMTNITVICINPYSKAAYIGLAHGELIVSESIKQIDKIISTIKYPPIESNIKMEISSIQCINENEVAVHYVGIITNDENPSACTIIYSENLKKGSIFQNMLYFTGYSDKKLECPHYMATIIDQQTPFLSVYSSLSPDVEFIAKDMKHDNNYHQIVFDSEQKFVCPVNEDFQETTIVGACSFTLDFDPFIIGNNDELHQPVFCDFVILLTSGGIIGVNALKFTQTINFNSKTITKLSECISVAKKSENITSRLIIDTKLDNEYDGNSKVTAESYAEQTDNYHDPFNTKILCDILNENVKKVPTEPIISLNDWKPTDFVFEAIEMQSANIHLPSICRPSFIEHSNGKNFINLEFIYSLLDPGKTFTSVIDNLGELKNKLQSHYLTLDESFLHMKDKINSCLSEFKKRSKFSLKQMHLHVEHQLKADFLYKLSDVANAQLSLANLDEFSKYSTFHCHNTLIYDKIYDIQNKIQYYLPKMSFVYEKLLPKKKKLICSGNRLEPHVIQHFINILEEARTIRKNTAYNLKNLAQKTNTFANFNVDEVYKNIIKNKVNKRVSKSIDCIKFKQIDNETQGSNFFDSLESFCGRKSKKNYCTLSSSIDHTQSKSTTSTCTTSTPRLNRANRESSLLGATCNSFNYDINPDQYFINVNDLLTSKQIDCMLPDYFADLCESSDQFNFGDNVYLSSEWALFLDSLKKIDSITNLTDNMISELFSGMDKAQKIEINRDSLYKASLFNVYKQDVIKLMGDDDIATEKCSNIDSIKTNISEYFYNEQLINYCKKHDIKYDPNSIKHKSQIDNIIKAFKNMGLSCDIYLPEEKRYQTSCGSRSTNKNNKNNDLVNTLIPSNLHTIRENTPSETNPSINNNTNVGNDQPIDNYTSDSSDCMDLTELYKDEELPLFLPLSIREQTVADYMESGNSIEDVDKTFGYKRWSYDNSKFKQSNYTSSYFNSLYGSPKDQINHKNSRNNNSVINSSSPTAIVSNDFNTETNKLLEIIDGAPMRTVNKSTGANTFSRSNVLTNNLKSNENKSSLFFLNPLNSHNGDISFEKDTYTGSYPNNLANRNSLFLNNTNILSQQQQCSFNANNIFNNGQDSSSANLPLPHNKSKTSNNIGDTDEWLGALSRPQCQQPTSMVTLHNYSNNVIPTSNTSSLMSTPYNQNSGSLLNFDAYKSDMKFNININKEDNFNDSFKFGSNAIVFSNTNVQPVTSGTMPAMLSNTQQQSSQSNTTNTSTNVFSSALKGFDLTPKFMDSK